MTAEVKPLPQRRGNAHPTDRPAPDAGRPLEDVASALDDLRGCSRAVLETLEAEAGLNAANLSATVRGSIVAGVLAVHVWLFALVLLGWWVTSLGVPLGAVAAAALVINLGALWLVAGALRRSAGALGFPRTRALLGLGDDA